MTEITMGAMEGLWKKLLEEVALEKGRKRELEEELKKKDELHAEDMKKEKQRHAEEMKKEKERRKAAKENLKKEKQRRKAAEENLEKEKQRHAEEMKKEKEQRVIELTEAIHDIEENFRGISSTELALSDEEEEETHTTNTPDVLKFQKTTRSLLDADDREWKIKKDVILGYLEVTKCKDWKLHRKNFREKIYMDDKYVKWSSIQEKNAEGPGYVRRKHGDQYVITAGCNWVNWKNTKGDWQCESFHFVKQIYDTMAKRK